MDQQVDVIVAGAGIAGSSAAIQLARAGHRTLLLDRQAFPRHKTCGEFMSPETREMLEYLGIDLLQLEEPARPMEQARIYLPGGGEIVAPLPGNAWGISRYELDVLLHRKARAEGVEILTQAAVTGISQREDRWYEAEVKLGNSKARYEARAVIGAYGTRRPKGLGEFGGTHRDEKVYVGVKSHYTGLEPENRVELYFSEHGYTGISPIQNGMANVAALLALDYVQGAGKSVPDILQGAAVNHPKLANRLKTAVPVQGTQVSVAPVRLSTAPEPWSTFPHIGDALLMIPPLCGDGMSIALRSALLCSDWTSRYLQGKVSRDEWENGYIQEAGREFGDLLRRARTVQKLAFSPMNRYYPGITRLFPGLASYVVKATRLAESGRYR